ncbi:MAG: hypothetical protein GEV04_13150 [Actinophytocola sp.]|nr:hypothetical protein [Actinophytocola sp.]
MTGRSDATMAWRDGDIVMLVVTALIGGIAIAAAWFGASGSATVSHQTAWLNLGVAGFAVFAGGTCLWLLRGRRAVGERRATLVAVEAAPPVTAPVDATASWQFVRGTGMRKLHHPGCPLLTGKPVEPAEPADGEPCGVCAV